MHLPFESVFTSYEAYAKFILGLLVLPIMNNFCLNHPDSDRIARYNLMIKLPRWVFAIILLFPSRHLKYKAELFCFISECVFIILIVVFSALALQGIQLPENMQYKLPQYVFYFNLTMWICAVIDSHFYELKRK